MARINHNFKGELVEFAVIYYETICDITQEQRVMKVTVILSGNTPREVIRAVNSPTVVQQIIHDLVKGYIDASCDETDFFVLPATVAVPRIHSGESAENYGCLVRLTGLAGCQIHNKEYNYNSGARILGGIYQKVIEQNLSQRSKFTIRAEIKVDYGLGESRTGEWVWQFKGKMKTPNADLPSFTLGNQRPSLTN